MQEVNTGGSAESEEVVDWTGFDNDEQLKEALRKCAQEGLIGTKGMSPEEAASSVAKHLQAKGFPYWPEISIGEPNEAGQRTVTGTTTSPQTEREISF